MRKIVAFVAVAATLATSTACDSFGQAMTAHKDVLARAGGHEHGKYCGVTRTGWAYVLRGRCDQRRTLSRVNVTASGQARAARGLQCASAWHP